MRSDGLLPYEFEEEPTSCELTGHVGLLPYIDLMCILGILKEADRKIGISGKQGWMDRQHLMALVLLNIAGGENVEDIRLLEVDEGLCRIVRHAEKYGLSKAERASLDLRFRKGRDRTFPSPTRLYEYLNKFHNSSEETKRLEGCAFIPEKNEYLLGLGEVNRSLIRSVVQHYLQAEATLDIDATLAETTKKEALYCYDGYRAYQPISAYWAETGLVVFSEFRDGNVPSGKFGANAAWWGMMVLAYNLHVAMRLLVLPEGMKKKRLKGIRFALIDVPGRVMCHARQLFVRLAKGHPALEWLVEMRRKLGQLFLSPAYQWR